MNSAAVADRQLSWIERLPAGIQPYAVLGRWDRPIGTWLLYWPCAWGTVLAPGIPSFTLLILFGIGAYAMRGAGCTLNDMADRELDQGVERTRNRPIASGAVSLYQAGAFFALQSLIGLVVLLSLNTSAIIIGLFSIPVIAIYPFMKRITDWPQVVLGIAFNWGALVSWAAVTGEVAWPAIWLYLAGICWTLGYDTIYAHQDKADDAIVGVRSSARALEGKTVPFLWLMYTLMIVLVMLAAWTAGLSWLVLPGLVAVAAHLIWQIRTLDIDHPDNCLARFRSNRDLGLILYTALLLGQFGASQP
ncbi:MAG: 4-hydroxybenzoate octaprenyltransferase [Geminicoccaceae bacterium]